MITARYRVIQIVRDHGCPEPETVGILLHTDALAELRLVGATADSARFEHGFFRHALPDLTSADWVYEQWVGWFRDVAAQMRTTPESALALLQRLEARGDPVIATVSGEMVVASYEAVSEAADQLYNELVLSRPMMRRAKFLGAVDGLLDASELRWFAGLRQDAEVDLVDDDHRLTNVLHFPYIWDSEELGRFGVKVVWFGGSENDVSVAVADAVNTFDVAQGRRVIRYDHCIVIHDTPTDHQLRYSKMLALRAVAIDAYAPTAVDDLRRVFFGG